MKIKYLFIFALLLFFAHAYSQAPPETWDLKFEGGAYVGYYLLPGQSFSVEWGHGEVELYVNDTDKLISETETKNFGGTATVKIWSETGVWKIHFAAPSSQGNIPLPEQYYLQEILSPCPQNLQLSRNLDGLFQYCKAIERVPSFLFSAFDEEITSVSAIFAKCVSLRTIGNGVFTNTPSLTNVSRAFWHCFSLESLPVGFLSKTDKLADLYEAFMYCKSLSALPRGMLADTPRLVVARNCFSHCYDLEELPDDIFSNTPRLINAERCFFRNSSLTRIPSKIFNNAPTDNIKDYPYDEISLAPTGKHLGNQGWSVLIDGNGTGRFEGYSNRIAIWINSSWTFWSRPHNFEAAFYECPKVTGNIPELWRGNGGLSRSYGYNAFYHSGKTIRQDDSTKTWQHTIPNIKDAAVSPAYSRRPDYFYPSWTGGYLSGE